MSRLVRILGWLLLALVVVILSVGSYGYLVLRRTLPPESGDRVLAGLEKPVRVYFDEKGVPQIFALTEADAYRALGFLHAGNRFFQMELLRRAAAGRLSALLGEATLAFDSRQRLIGHYRLTEGQVDDLTPRARKGIGAYVEGVNAWVAEAGLPFELRLLRAPVEPWTVPDILAIASFQTYYGDELRNPDDRFFEPLRRAVGAERTRELLLEYPEWAPTTIPSPNVKPGVVPPLLPVEAGMPGPSRLLEALSLGLARQAFPSTEAAERVVRSLALAGGSNAWAVAPRLSRSGAALFANDPHLDVVSLPGFWYMAGMHSAEGETEVVGITSPGLPLMAMGHSRWAAWGFTVAAVDLRDLYQVEVDPERPSWYRTPDGWAEMTIREEWIEVRGREPELRLIEWTRHGPVVHRDSTTHTAIAWRWAGLDLPVSKLLNATIEVPEMRDWERFHAAISGSAFNINWVYADAAGHIGYHLGASFPVRGYEESTLPLDGASARFDWQGYHDASKTPKVSDPEQGWLASSNHRAAPPDFPIPMPGAYYVDRALRITELLSSDSLFDVSDMTAFQLDHLDRYAERWRDPAVEYLHVLGERALAEEVARWDGQMTVDSRVAALIYTWQAEILRSTFEDEVDAEPPYEVLDRLLADPHSPWFDDVRTQEVETRDTVLTRSLRIAVDAVGEKTWGALHTLTMSHPFAANPLLRILLGLQRGPYATGGSMGSLNASFPRYDGAGRFSMTAGPSWRHVVDFSDLDGSLVVLPHGQSGHPLSRHFFDFFDDWYGGRYHNLPISEARIRAAAVSEMTLRPGV